MSKRFRVIFSVACAVLAFLLSYLYVQQVQAQASAQRSEALERYGGEVVDLVVTTRDLSQGEVVRASDVTTKEWISDLAPSGAQTKKDAVVGKRLTSTVPKGNPVCEVHFDWDSADLDIPEGYVAVTLLQTDNLGIPANLSSNTKLIAYSVGKDSTKELANDLQLLSQSGKDDNQLGSQSVTIAARPEQVAGVLSANAAGNLRLAVPSAQNAQTQGEDAS